MRGGRGAGGGQVRLTVHLLQLCDRQGQNGKALSRGKTTGCNGKTYGGSVLLPASLKLRRNSTGWNGSDKERLSAIHFSGNLPGFDLPQTSAQKEGINEPRR